jgi:glycosyltransferase 2 family protein
MKRKYIGSFLLGSLSLLLLWLVLRNVSWADLSRAIRSARPGWVAGAMLAVLTYYGLRAVRWQLMLRAMHRRVSLLHALLALLTGNLSSLLVPGAGEVMRLGTLRRTDGVPLSESLGSLVAERSFDILMLLVGLLLNLGLLAAQGQVVGQSGLSIRTQNWPLWLLGLALGGGLLVLTLGLAWRVLGRSAWGQAWLGRLRQFRAGFVSGLLGTWRAGLLWPVAGLTVLIWLVGLLTYGLIFTALPLSENLPVLGWLTVNSLVSISSIAVPTQGGIGSFHVSAAYGLGLFGVDAPTAAIIATFAHAVLTAANLLLNGLGLLLLTVYINPLLLAKSESIHEISDIPPSR